MLEDVAERCGLIECTKRRGQSRSLGVLRSQLPYLSLYGLEREAGALSIALCELDRFLKLTPRRVLTLPAALEVLTALLEVPIRLFEFLLALIEILPMSLEALIALLELALERFACTPQVVETPAGHVELIAHVAEHTFESGESNVISIGNGLVRWNHTYIPRLYRSGPVVTTHFALFA